MLSYVGRDKEDTRNIILSNVSKGITEGREERRQKDKI